MAWSMDGKNWRNVALEHVAIAARKVLAAVQGAVGALADPVGIAVVDEGPLKDRLDDAHRAWCTTRSRKGAAEIRRRLGSWM